VEAGSSAGRSYPACSRSRTDNCTQMGGRHSAMRHRRGR
jgi:hypothetical protein